VTNGQIMTTSKLIARLIARAAVLSVLVAGAGAGAGCNLEPSVPGSPTYEADVKPILEARCIRCHGYPQLVGATPMVRFDVYDCSGDAGVPGCAVGAKVAAPLMKSRIQLGKNDPLHMPPKPAAPLSQYQIDTIAKWADSGAPEL